MPALLWMGLIFSASSDQRSFPHSSRIIAPIVLWLFPQASDEAIHAVVVFARKCAHLTEYALLSMLLWRALRKPRKDDVRAWRWSHAGLALALAALYSASDEFHQRFVPAREASVGDVLLDTLGGALGLLGLWAIARLRQRRG
jgi:VanZ family protein